MAHVPVYCNDCKIVFYSGISLEESSARLENIYSTCPNCDKPIPIPNGIYQETKNVLSVLESQNDTFNNGIISIYYSDFSPDLKLKLIDQLFLYNSGESLSNAMEKTNKSLGNNPKLILSYIISIMKGIGNITSGLKGIEWLAEKFL